MISALKWVKRVKKRTPSNVPRINLNLANGNLIAALPIWDLHKNIFLVKLIFQQFSCP
jgi:hypothetical protein